MVAETPVKENGYRYVLPPQHKQHNQVSVQTPARVMCSAELWACAATMLAYLMNRRNQDMYRQVSCMLNGPILYHLLKQFSLGG